MRQVQIRQVKQGGYFQRKNKGPVWIRNHYNRKDQFGPACFSISKTEDMNHESFIKPLVLVWVD